MRSGTEKMLTSTMATPGDIRALPNSNGTTCLPMWSIIDILSLFFGFLIPPLYFCHLMDIGLSAF